MNNRERNKIEFDHLERLLAGLGSPGPAKTGRQGRTARAIFEHFQSRFYDRPGCFAYIGWDTKHGSHAPEAKDQLVIYGAFARSAVANGIYLGALEPNEGFGLVGWRDELLPSTADPYYREAMRHTIHAAADILAGASGWAQTNLAFGWGRLRGNALVEGRPYHPWFLLNGPAVVDTVYGDLPNRCGGLAKGKDPAFAKNQLPLPSGSSQLMEVRQSWMILHGSDPLQPAVTSAALVQPDEQPRKITSADRQPFLIGFSLDFAQSSLEYSRDVHRARTVVDQILAAFEQLADKADMENFFVSPRYGDGLAAVIVLEINSDAAAFDVNLPWINHVKEFCKFADGLLGQCQLLGLRVAMAIDRDDNACAPRLAGARRTASPIVEPLADRVLTRARRCHDLAKDKTSPVPAIQSVKWLYLPPNKATMDIIAFPGSDRKSAG